jgi:protein disulfide-isomerase
MRFLPISILCALFATVALGESIEEAIASPDASGEESLSTEEWDEGPASTRFNEIEVPPITDIDGEMFESTVKDGYWFVKHHS